ncbi:MAG: hypothetical protein MMC23_006619 [Stictis urceolatum]|nr:hypothetical protein [Stictis urceolata]
MIVLDTVQCQIFTKSDENDGKYFPLEEYDDDHSDSDDCETNSPTIRYIEAKTGTKFQIRLTVLTGFKWRGADALLANYDFDGGALRGGEEIAQKARMHEAQDTGSIKVEIAREINAKKVLTKKSIAQGVSHTFTTGSARAVEDPSAVKS